MEAAAESSERRYNTRFRGVPRSIFTYPRSGKKSNSKSNNANHVRNDIRDDFVYTKLGKKPSSQSRDMESPPKVKIKIEPPSPTLKNEKKQSKQDSSKNIIPNGTHHKETELLDENTILKIEKPDEEFSPDISPKLEKDEEIFFESTAPLEINEFQSTSNDSKAHWITSKEKLSWDASNVASYNPKTKMFRCVVCQAVGFMSRIGEHYLGTHCNAKVFHCPQCSYCSAWWRCVRNHMSKNHGVSNAPASMWKNQPLLDEIMQILQNLKYSVDCEDRVERVAENSGKRYICPKCPYATDRRDLYNRHENIHREEKPFQCYICYKLFNRADHVKKHFCRIHKDYNYDINLIRRLPSKRSRIPVSPSLNGCSSNTNQDLSTSRNVSVSKPSPISNPVTQSHLLNCLTGSPTMVKVAREIDHLPDISENKVPETESKNENTFNKSHSNLLTFLTQNAFCPKPLPKSSTKPRESPVNDILQNALLKPTVPSPSQQNNQPKKFHCPYCPWTGPNAWAHRIHTSMHYKTFCVLCNFKSSDLKDLECHMWESHRKRLCGKCNFLADNLAVLDSHMADVHGVKHHFSCRHCSQSFEVRSDMEAHCIFIHNQVLQECKQEGCDFCTTDPDVLETHRNEKHIVSSSKTQETSASRTLCLYCGCDFADPQSLALHEELFHENPLQKAGLRPLNPYCCSVCGYSTPKQPMMIEHMRIHTGQVLRCQAGDGCLFHTPYDTVLREHVLQTHNTDDGIVRCPHCGLRCSTRYSFVSHYQELHHPFCCQLCEEVENKHFVLPCSTSFLDSSISTLFPFAKKVKSLSNSKPHDGFGASADQDAGRRSRKQMQPRKVVQDPGAENTILTDVQNSSTRIKANPFGYTKRENKFISLYAKKIRKIAQMSLLKCRFCVKCPIYFRHRRNYLLHRQWHSLKRHQCNKCIQTYRHHYQVLLHQREHDKDITNSS